MKNYEKAKQIFRECSGNKYFMNLNGVYEEYESYNVPKYLEEQWKRGISDEYAEKLEAAETMKEVSDSFFGYRNSHISREEKASNMMDYIIANSEGWDSFTRVLCFEAFIGVMKSLSSGIARRSYYWKIFKLAGKTAKGKITIAQEYKDDKERFVDITEADVLRRLNNVLACCRKGIVLGKQEII